MTEQRTLLPPGVRKLFTVSLCGQYGCTKAWRCYSYTCLSRIVQELGDAYYFSYSVFAFLDMGLIMGFRVWRRYHWFGSPIVRCACKQRACHGCAYTSILEGARGGPRRGQLGLEYGGRRGSATVVRSLVRIIDFRLLVVRIALSQRGVGVGHYCFVPGYSVPAWFSNTGMVLGYFHVATKLFVCMRECSYRFCVPCQIRCGLVLCVRWLTRP